MKKIRKKVMVICVILVAAITLLSSCSFGTTNENVEETSFSENSTSNTIHIGKYLDLRINK